MDSMPKLKIFVMLLSLATFTAMVILNAGNATGLFKGNASKCFLFREMSLVHCITLWCLRSVSLLQTIRASSSPLKTKQMVWMYLLVKVCFYICCPCIPGGSFPGPVAVGFLEGGAWLACCPAQNAPHAVRNESRASLWLLHTTGFSGSVQEKGAQGSP